MSQERTYPPKEGEIREEWQYYQNDNREVHRLVDPEKQAAWIQSDTTYEVEQ